MSDISALAQLYSHEFVNCAGSVLFRRDASGAPPQVCILHNRKNGQYVLPKGRQDIGEAPSQTAIRETCEETGNRCQFLPVQMTTRATPPDQDVEDEPREIKDCTEPFALTVRKARSGSVKLIWWYITLYTTESPDERDGPTQTASEDYEAVWCTIQPDDGVLRGDELKAGITAENAACSIAARLSLEKDGEVLKKAVQLVTQTYPQWFCVA